MCRTHQLHTQVPATRASDKHIGKHRRQFQAQHAGRSEKQSPVTMQTLLPMEDRPTSLPLLSADLAGTTQALSSQLSKLNSGTAPDDSRNALESQFLQLNQCRSFQKSPSSRRASSTRSIAELDESDLPLSALAAHSRRQSMLAEGSQMSARLADQSSIQVGCSNKQPLDVIHHPPEHKPYIITNSVRQQEMLGDPKGLDSEGLFQQRQGVSCTDQSSELECIGRLSAQVIGGVSPE